MSPCGKTFRSYAAAAKYAKEQSIEARCFPEAFFYRVDVFDSGGRPRPKCRVGRPESRQFTL